jgi:hypothetical protein
MREFPGEGGKVGFDRFEHRRRIPELEAGSQNGKLKPVRALHFPAMHPSPPCEQQPEQQNQQYQQIEANDDPPQCFCEVFIKRRCHQIRLFGRDRSPR